MEEGGGKRRTQAEGERWPPRRRNDGLGRRRTQEEKEGTVSLPLPLCSFLPPLCSFPDSLTLGLALRLSTTQTLSLSGTLSPTSHSDSLALKLILTLRPLTLRNSQTTQTHNHIQTTHSDHSRTLRPTLWDSDHSHSDTHALSLVIHRLMHIDSLTLRLAHTQTHSHTGSPALSPSYSDPLIPRLSRTQTLAAEKSRQIDTHMGIPASNNSSCADF